MTVNMQNVLSFDIEEWFHPEMFAGRFPREQWDELESRVEQNTHLILDFLKGKKLTATFFFLGWVAEKYPHLVTRCAEEGHEIATHGYAHIMVNKMTPQEFRTDLRKSIEVLNALSPEPVRGFRAPTFSITKKTMWAVPIMFEEGIRFDSSVFPIYHDRYGIPDAPRLPYLLHEQDGEQLVEYPMTAVKIGTYNLPCGGGGYFRLYPLRMSVQLMKKCQRDGRPIMFYAHPWEFDVLQPKVDLGRLARARHYMGIKKFLKRLDVITDLFPFTSFREAGLAVQ